MATIKFKRGSGFPTGLTGYEPAWDTSLSKLYFHNGSTAIWIGAQIDGNTALSGNCAYTVPTQQAVKSYVDANIAAGAVSSINGLVGAVTLRTDTISGITLAVGSGGITLAHNVVNYSKADPDRYIGFYGVTSGKAVPYVSEDLVFATSTATIKGTRGIALQGFTSSVFGGNYSNLSVRHDGITLATNGGFIDISSTNTVSINSPSGINIWTVDMGSPTYKGTLTTSALTTANRTYTLPDASGTVALTNTSVASVAGITGAVNITGTTNQISTAVSGQTLTISLPSAVTMPGSLTVTGDLTVNGTTTTVNATTVTVQDPIIAIGGLTGNAVPASGDVKDRGIVAQYRNASNVGATCFFGIDRSVGVFTFIPNATVTAEVIGGSAGSALLNGVQSESGSPLVLSGINTNSAQISLTGNASIGSEAIELKAGRVLITNPAGTPNGGKLEILDTSGSYYTTVTTSSLAANTTITLPNHTGTIVAPTNLGTSGYILKANGTSSQPTWVDPATTAAGTLVTAEANGTYYLTMATGVASGGTGFYVDTTATALTYVTSTGTLTCTKIEAIVDGGSYP